MPVIKSVDYCKMPLAELIEDPAMPVEYRPIPSWPGYVAGDDGSIWSCLKRGGRIWTLTDNWRQRKLTLDYRGYLVLSMRRQGCKRSFVMQSHRLVLEAFAGPCPEGMECCHYDGNRTNNKLTNLRWDTRKGNRQDAIRHGTLVRGVKTKHALLNDDAVRDIRLRYADGETSRSIAESYGVAVSTIKGVVSRRKWAHVLDIIGEEEL